MYLAIVAAHVVLSLTLIFIILVQPGRGGDVGAAFGGGDSSLFGPRGPANVLSRITSAVAVLFMVTSVTLAYFSNKEILANSNVLDEIERVNQERQKEKEAAAAPVEAVPAGDVGEVEGAVLPVEPAPAEEAPPASPEGGEAPPPTP